ncbi:hypothetical protein SSX86_030643 [Deinandra increscens subsp. villosa]|uniref:Uncharacterized protein n=1 Tax=Deinandra increscens subsp. villosa TaxID=3103831 RepID=A0AAP0CAE4_9ASTR
MLLSEVVEEIELEVESDVEQVDCESVAGELTEDEQEVEVPNPPVQVEECSEPTEDVHIEESMTENPPGNTNLSILNNNQFVECEQVQLSSRKRKVVEEDVGQVVMKTLRSDDLDVPRVQLQAWIRHVNYRAHVGNSKGKCSIRDKFVFNFKINLFCMLSLKRKIKRRVNYRAFIGNVIGKCGLKKVNVACEIPSVHRELGWEVWTEATVSREGRMVWLKTINLALPGRQPSGVGSVFGDGIEQNRMFQIIAIVGLKRGIPSKRESSARVDYVPALCTHRPSLLPIEWSGEVLGSWRRGRFAAGDVARIPLNLII